MIDFLLKYEFTSWRYHMHYKHIEQFELKIHLNGVT